MSPTYADLVDTACANWCAANQALVAGDNGTATLTPGQLFKNVKPMISRVKKHDWGQIFGLSADVSRDVAKLLAAAPWEEIAQPEAVEPVSELAAALADLYHPVLAFVRKNQGLAVAAAAGSQGSKLSQNQATLEKGRWLTFVRNAVTDALLSAETEVSVAGVTAYCEKRTGEGFLRDYLASKKSESSPVGRSLTPNQDSAIADQDDDAQPVHHLPCEELAEKLSCLVQRHMNSFIGIAVGYGLDYHTAHDVVSTATLKLLKRSHLAEKNLTFPYIRRVVKNCCLDYLRKQKKESKRYEKAFGRPAGVAEGSTVSEYHSDPDSSSSVQQFASAASVLQTSLHQSVSDPLFGSADVFVTSAVSIVDSVLSSDFEGVSKPSWQLFRGALENFTEMVGNNDSYLDDPFAKSTDRTFLRDLLCAELLRSAHENNTKMGETTALKKARAHAKVIKEQAAFFAQGNTSV